MERFKCGEFDSYKCHVRKNYYLLWNVDILQRSKGKGSQVKKYVTYNLMKIAICNNSHNILIKNCCTVFVRSRNFPDTGVINTSILLENKISSFTIGQAFKSSFLHKINGISDENIGIQYDFIYAHSNTLYKINYSLKRNSIENIRLKLLKLCENK